MSKRSKLEKFAQNLDLANVFEHFGYEDDALYANADTKVNFRGRWCEGHFGNDHLLTLELACGRGEYSLGMSELHPGRNFIGIDIKGARIWNGATQALRRGLTNVAFVRTRIEGLSRFFADGEVDEIWITFPDPFPRSGKASRRLTSPEFLDRYVRVLRPGAVLHLKTDDPALYAFSLECVDAHFAYERLFASASIYESSFEFPEKNIRTYYEKLHLAAGKKIHYLRFRFTGGLPA
ncbi:MAG: tRNA (guanosine(46)-N7)-methyltransferase TrmB [Saprospiraceae bacterium]|jgi:tRNA (guanine-N7-)-methyltransferase|nr:tRNA (guanosine(46)-N7)-methyltransferase TrmB [Saprospiraceae bacterium]MBP9208740.1 tRNA (guanosine(46)-N7)-methyltransferase TrmB [Saprospiraceae bacterium]